MCRNNNGDYLGSSAFGVRGLIEPSTLEAIACREGLSLAEDLGLQNMVIASDCQEVVKHIKKIRWKLRWSGERDNFVAIFF